MEENRLKKGSVDITPEELIVLDKRLMSEVPAFKFIKENYPASLVKAYGITKVFDFMGQDDTEKLLILASIITSLEGNGYKNLLEHVKTMGKIQEIVNEYRKEIRP